MTKVTRFLLVWIRRLFVVFSVMILALFTLPAWNRTQCIGPAHSQKHASVLSPEYHRVEVDTLLAYPARHIAYERADYAKTIRNGDPHDYAYLASVTGYWSALCAITGKAGYHGGTEGRLGHIYAAGLGFTVEMVAKAAYEETLGRLAVLARGSEKSPLDDASAAQSALRASFLEEATWTTWDYRAELATYKDTPRNGFRDWERRVALGLELGAKARLADWIKEPSTDDTALHFVVRGMETQDLAEIEGLSVIEELAQGTKVALEDEQKITLVFTAISEAGGRFIEVSGNDEIMFSALANGPAYGAFHTHTRQGRGDRRHLFMVKVLDLSRLLRSLENRGMTLERIYPYG